MTRIAKLLTALSLAVALSAFSAPASASFTATPADPSAKVLLTRLAAKDGRSLVWQLRRDYKIGSAERFNAASGLDQATNVDSAVAKVLTLLNKNRPEDPAAYACQRMHGASAILVIRRGGCAAN